MTVFVRLLDSGDKASALRNAAVHGTEAAVFDVDCSELRSIGTSPFAYWLPSAVRRAFGRSEPLASHGWTSKQGLITGDNFRLVRVWWEVASQPAGGVGWLPFANGGKLSAYYSDILQVVDYGYAGQEAIKQRGRYGRGADYYFRPGLTWPLRSSSFSPQVLPAGCLFSQRGQATFHDRLDVGLAYLGVLGSSVFDYLYKTRVGRGGFPEFLAGVLAEMPIPRVVGDDLKKLSGLVRNAWSAQRSEELSTETSHAFVMPGLVGTVSADLPRQAAAYRLRRDAAQSALEEVQVELDDLSAEMYRLSPDDRAKLSHGSWAEDETDTADIVNEDGVETAADVAALAAGLVSWCVGVGVGRFDVRLATGEREWPVEPDPFDPLPLCSPGMLTGDDGLPLAVPPAGYPVEVSAVLVDDPGHRLDITARVRSVFDVVFDDSHAWWADVGEALGARRGEIDSWLSKAFFDHHLKTYSKSRRKAPILWPLGTASGSYLVWLYAHRVTPDSLFRVLNDVMSPKLALERRGLSELVQDAGPIPSSGQRKAIDTQEKLIGELEDLIKQLTAVAPFWHPDLNDGVVIVLAPLWRLFAHHKAWSKELRTHWENLVEGEYDWAQLAMWLWPERVVPKCAEDRSLAIAHGLEEVFWVQDEDNLDRWRPRQAPTVPIGLLIADRTDPAIKAALEGAS